MQVLFDLIHKDAKLPERGHSIDVGLDVFVPEEGVLLPGPNMIPLGFRVDVPVGYNCSIYPRSGMVSGAKTLDLKVVDNHLPEEPTVGELYPNGISIFATHPPIDPGYKGQVHAIVLNHSNKAIRYPKHTRFGQLVFHPIAYAVPTLAVDNSRGEGGFGSTGL